MRTCALGVRCVSSTSGVLPTRSSRDLDVSSLIPSEAKERASPAGHGGKEDHGLALADRRVEAGEGAYLLALGVDVHERRDLLVAVEELGAQRREAAPQGVEHPPDRAGPRRELGLAGG